MIRLLVYCLFVCLFVYYLSVLLKPYKIFYSESRWCFRYIYNSLLFNYFISWKPMTYSLLCFLFCSFFFFFNSWGQEQPLTHPTRFVFLTSSLTILLSEFDLSQQQRSISPWLKRETIQGTTSFHKPAVDFHGQFKRNGSDWRNVIFVVCFLQFVNLECTHLRTRYNAGMILRSPVS